MVRWQASRNSAVGLGAEPFRHELADGVLAQRAGPDVRGGRIVGDLGQQRGVGRRVAGADAGGDQHRLALEPADQVGEKPQRRAVAPLEVVDLEQQRALGGEVERQPVQAVERGERRVAGRRSLVGRGEHDARGRGGAGQCVGIGDDGLEELADDAEREVALQLAGARVEHHRAAGVRVAPELRQQPRLADPGRALDQHRAALAHAGLGEQGVEQRHLAVALDQAAGRRPRLLDGRGRVHRAAAARAGRRARAPGVLPSSSRSSTRMSSYTRSASLTLPRARRTSISATRADSRYGCAWTAARAACSASGQRGAAEPDPGGGERLQRLDAQVGELGAAGIDPGRLEARQQAALGDLDRLAGRLPGVLGAAVVERVAGGSDALGRDLPVDPGVLGQDQVQFGTPFQHARAERLAQAAQRRGEQRLVRGRRALARPQRLGELVTADRAVAVQRQVREEQPTLASAQRVFEPPSLELHDEPSA